MGCGWLKNDLLFFFPQSLFFFFFFHQCLPNTFRRNSWERTGVNKSEAKRLFRVLGSCFPGTCPQFLIGPPTVNSSIKVNWNVGTSLSYISTVYWTKEWMNEWMSEWVATLSENNCTFMAIISQWVQPQCMITLYIHSRCLHTHKLFTLACLQKLKNIIYSHLNTAALWVLLHSSCHSCCWWRKGVIGQSGSRGLGPGGHEGEAKWTQRNWCFHIPLFGAG